MLVRLPVSSVLDSSMRLPLKHLPTVSSERLISMPKSQELSLLSILDTPNCLWHSLHSSQERWRSSAPTQTRTLEPVKSISFYSILFPMLSRRSTVAIQEKVPELDWDVSILSKRWESSWPVIKRPMSSVRLSWRMRILNSTTPENNWKILWDHSLLTSSNALRMHSPNQD